MKTLSFLLIYIAMAMINTNVMGKYIGSEYIEINTDKIKRGDDNDNDNNNTKENIQKKIKDDGFEISEVIYEISGDSDYINDLVNALNESIIHHKIKTTENEDISNGDYDKSEFNWIINVSDIKKKGGKEDQFLNDSEYIEIIPFSYVSTDSKEKTTEDLKTSLVDVMEQELSKIKDINKNKSQEDVKNENNETSHNEQNMTITTTTTDSDSNKNNEDNKIKNENENAEEKKDTGITDSVNEDKNLTVDDNNILTTFDVDTNNTDKNTDEKIEINDTQSNPPVTTNDENTNQITSKINENYELNNNDQKQSVNPCFKDCQESVDSCAKCFRIASPSRDNVLDAEQCINDCNMALNTSTGSNNNIITLNECHQTCIYQFFVNNKSENVNNEDVNVNQALSNSTSILPGNNTSEIGSNNSTMDKDAEVSGVRIFRNYKNNYSFLLNFIFIYLIFNYII